MTPDRASAIIIKDKQILMIFRRYQGQEYYSFPGGKIEPGETPEIAVEREILEETSLTCTKSDYLFSVEELDVENQPRKNYFYKCEVASGTPSLGGPEKNHQSSTNYYEPMWISLERLKTSNWGASEIARKRIEEYLSQTHL